MQPQTYKVLLVEDDEDDFLLMKVYLRAVTVCQVLLIWVDTYEKALHYLEQYSPDMLLIDYNLNGSRNGLNLVRELKENGSGIPAILVTAQDKEALGKDWDSAIPDGYINKNQLTPKVLTDTIYPFLR